MLGLTLIKAKSFISINNFIFLTYFCNESVMLGRYSPSMNLWILNAVVKIGMQYLAFPDIPVFNNLFVFRIVINIPDIFTRRKHFSFCNLRRRIICVVNMNVVIYKIQIIQELSRYENYCNRLRLCWSGFWRLPC